MLNIAIANATPALGEIAARTLYLAKNGSDLELSLSNVDGSELYMVPTRADIATMIGTAINTDAGLIPVVAADYAALTALVPTLEKNTFVFVNDASGDATVDAGSALYFVDADQGTFTKVYEYEGLDVQIPNLAILENFSEVGGQLHYNGVQLLQVTNTVNQW